LSGPIDNLLDVGGGVSRIIGGNDGGYHRDSVAAVFYHRRRIIPV
jgi:hypothetical protein